MSAASPSWSRLELGSSSTSRRGPAEHRPGQAQALPLAGREQPPGLADIGVVALRQAQDHVVHVGHLGGLDHRLGGASMSRAMLSRTVPPNSSTSCGR